MEEDKMNDGNISPEEIAAKGRLERGYDSVPSEADGVKAGVSEQNATAVDPYALTQEEIAGATKGVDTQIDTLRKFIDGLDAPETKEQRERREKRERSRRVIAALGDGLSAMSNLYFTTQYAPDSYKPQESASERVRARQEQLRKQREANEDTYMRYVLAAGNAESEKARILDELRNRKQARVIAQQKAERDARLEPVIYSTKLAELDDAQNKATISGENAKVAPQLAQNEVKAGEALIGQRNAAANASNAEAGASVARGESYSRQGFKASLPDDNGEMVEYYSKADYEARLAQLVKQYGIHTHQAVKIETTQLSHDGKKKGSSTKTELRRKTNAELAGEVISKAAANAKGKGYGDNDNRGY